MVNMAKNKPMKKVWIHFPEGLMDYMDDLIKSGNYTTKAQIIRYCVRLHKDSKFLE